MIIQVRFLARFWCLQWRSCLLLILLVCSFSANATPPDYKSFKRVQSIAPPDLAPQSEWLEIWAIYIGQGDALLIRLPETLSYDLNGTRERIDILVDGGPGHPLRTFLHDIYDNSTRIEHVVLTHHDSDHVNGLTILLEDNLFGIERIYHNGLASWIRGIKGFPPSGQLPKSGQVFLEKRGLAIPEDDGITLGTQFFIDGLTLLGQAQRDGQLEGIYDDFANAIGTKSMPVRVSEFSHTRKGSAFINEAEGSRIGNDIQFDVLWPVEPQRRYRAWSQTINGNSLTFKLTYRNFTMLFSGDHNDDSETVWLNQLDGQADKLKSDVLKIPHHGSKHNLEKFVDAVEPVVGIASMGSQGFGQGWKHPSEEIIRWMGGPHRVYSTFIHERRFKYDHLAKDDTLRDALIESKHVLIQTDGHWFRVVETEDPDNIPTVAGTRRGDGTRWIRAQE